MTIGLPCKNPSCKSHGKPHPNCKCYGNFAKGGGVGGFCDSDNTHNLGCEYFAEGGLAEPIDHAHEALGYFAHHGLHGLLKMHKQNQEKAMELHHHYIKKGHKKLDAHLDHIFGDVKLDKEDHEENVKAIDEWISKGGIENDLRHEQYNQNSGEQNFAEGGEVKKDKKEHPGVLGHHPIETHYPEQNMALQVVKGRASGYLNSLKPKPNQPKLAFDKEPSQQQQKKAYEHALKIATHPLGVVTKIKKGNVQPEDVQNLNALYPEMAEKMRQKLTEKITKEQLSGKKPSYKVRQGLSLFLGVPLSSEMKPENIAAIQAVFKSPTAQPQQSAPSGQKKTSALDKSSQAYLTSNSAAASRQQKQ